MEQNETGKTVQPENGDSADITTLLGKIKKELDPTNKSLYSKILSLFQSNDLKKIYSILLEYKRAIKANPCKNGNNLFHVLIEKIDLKSIDLFLSDQKKAYTYEQTSIYLDLSKLLDLRNNQGFTPLGLAIKIYGDKEIDHKTQDRLAQIIKKLLDQSRKVWSKETENGNHELHAIVALHSKHELPETKKIFLKEVAEQLTKMDADLHLVNKVNSKKETPLGIAVKRNNIKMFNHLCPLSNQRNRHTALNLALETKKCHRKNSDPTTQPNINEMIQTLKNWNKRYSN